MTSIDPCAWPNALTCAAVFAVAPQVLGGVVLRAGPGPVRDAWLGLVRQWLPEGVAPKRVPLRISDERLLGGLDLAASLRSGRPILQPGILSEANQGVLVLAMAERLTNAFAGRLGSVLDCGEVRLERDGIGQRYAAKVAVIALDEGQNEDERPPAALRDRLALQSELDSVAMSEIKQCSYDAAQIASARERFPMVTIEHSAIEALCATAVALGVSSLRASLYAAHAARAAAALAGRLVVNESDATLAARLILAWRATQIPGDEAQQPPGETPEAGDEPKEAAQPDSEPGSEREPSENDEQSAPDADVVIAAAKAAIPAGLLAELKVLGSTSRPTSNGRSGQTQTSGLRGRPIGARRGDLTKGARLDLVETLRAAAPWQTLRRRERTLADLSLHNARPIEVRREDFHVKRLVQRTQTTTIFVVDASGSAALHRLAETKGAVELLLAECYVRRDCVAVLGFRNRDAELLLSPTRSLVRAKRSLAGLRAGGGTPLASALDVTLSLADSIRRRGDTPVVVVLSDGRANVARDGSRGRELAERDAMQAAAAFRAGRYTSLFIDTSVQPAPVGRRIAQQLGARYLALPHADSAALSEAVRSVNR